MDLFCRAKLVYSLLSFSSSLQYRSLWFSPATSTSDQFVMARPQLTGFMSSLAAQS